MSLVRCPSCSARVAAKLLPLHMKRCRAHRLKSKRAHASAAVEEVVDHALVPAGAGEVQAAAVEEEAQSEAPEAKQKKGKKK